MSDERLAGLEPALLWQRFSELTRLARPSQAEGPAREHVLRWATARNLATATDHVGNVAVRVPGAPDRSEAATVVLQSHLDMVCERDAGSPFDPREGRIDVRVEDDWVVAAGTTLGADNGIGVAAALALVDDAAVEHGPLELLFTVSEEEGLAGAKALDPSLVSGRLLVNLDGSSEGSLTVGCAGSDHTRLRLPLGSSPPSADDAVLRVALSGASGGHSGGDVATGRANAIKELGRILGAAFLATPFRLAALDGGVSRNAIPRDSQATVAVETGAEQAFRAAAEAELVQVACRFAGTERGLALEIAPTTAIPVATPATTSRALDLVAATTSGVVEMSPELADLVQTSTSLTTAVTTDGTLTLGSMTRSSNAGALDSVLGEMRALARLAGAEIDVRRSYPPWEPRLDSRLLAAAKHTYARLFAIEPALSVVHGGLECAVLGQKLAGVEMISIGPELVGLHAPGEKARISSTQRFYRLLGALLNDLSR